MSGQAPMQTRLPSTAPSTATSLKTVTKMAGTENSHAVTQTVKASGPGPVSAEIILDDEGHTEEVEVKRPLPAGHEAFRQVVVNLAPKQGLMRREDYEHVDREYARRVRPALRSERPAASKWQPMLEAKALSDIAALVAQCSLIQVTSKSGHRVIPGLSSSGSGSGQGQSATVSSQSKPGPARRKLPNFDDDPPLPPPPAPDSDIPPPPPPQQQEEEQNVDKKQKELGTNGTARSNSNTNATLGHSTTDANANANADADGSSSPFLALDSDSGNAPFGIQIGALPRNYLLKPAIARLLAIMAPQHRSALRDFFEHEVPHAITHSRLPRVIVMQTPTAWTPAPSNAAGSTPTTTTLVSLPVASKTPKLEHKQQLSEPSRPSVSSVDAGVDTKDAANNFIPGSLLWSLKHDDPWREAQADEAAAGQRVITVMQEPQTASQQQPSKAATSTAKPQTLAPAVMTTLKLKPLSIDAVMNTFYGPVMEYLDIRCMLVSMSRVSKRWNRLATDYSIWHYMLERRYRHSFPFVEESAKEERAQLLAQWKSFFQYVFAVENFGR